MPLMPLLMSLGEEEASLHLSLSLLPSSSPSSPSSSSLRAATAVICTARQERDKGGREDTVPGVFVGGVAPPPTSPDICEAAATNTPARDGDAGAGGAGGSCEDEKEEDDEEVEEVGEVKVA